jgi:ATP-dependent Clp protease ATP-binding subunit ClpX
MGFSADAQSGVDAPDQDRQDLAETLSQLTADDLVKFGMIPEFVGRLPVLTTLAPLSEADLLRVLREPKNALVRQYQRLFAIEGKELEFTEDALRVIVKNAMKRETGVRAMRAIFEEVMLDLMYELPDRKDIHHYVVTPEVVRGEAQVVTRPARKRQAKRGA